MELQTICNIIYALSFAALIGYECYSVKKHNKEQWTKFNENEAKRAAREEEE